MKKRFIGDLSQLSSEIVVVSREPDKSGLSEISLGVFRTLSPSTKITWLNVFSPFTPGQLRRHAVAGRSIYFTELPENKSAYGKVLNEIIKITNVGVYYVWDSTVLPTEDIEFLKKFAFVFTPSGQLNKILNELGIQAEELPIALDTRPYQILGHARFAEGLSSQRTVKLLSIGSFHPRKNHEITLGAVTKLLDQGLDLELRIHSNLAFGSEYKKLIAKVSKSYSSRIEISTGSLSESEIKELISQADVYISSSGGETFDIGLRNAIAAGLVCVATNIMGHENISEYENVFLVPSNNPVPAIYPERNNQVFGAQFVPEQRDLEKAIVSASETARKVRFPGQRVSWDFRALVFRYRKAFLKTRGIGSKVSVAAHDGGFFSIFNAFISLKANWENLGGFGEIAPDWSVTTLKNFWQIDKYTSFCYGTEDDGEIFGKLMVPKIDSGITQSEIRALEVHSFDAFCNPDLTYIHANRLYRSTYFAEWRKHMNSALSQFEVSEKIAEKVNTTFSGLDRGTVLIGMHVRHPSHAIEQPGNVIAYSDDYIRVAKELMDEIAMPTRVFLATDQESVIQTFREAFGNDLLVLEEVERTSELQDAHFNALSESEQKREGHQIQHVKSSSESNWSLNMAEEVMVDAWCLSKCDYLIHSVSNVATAVSFINPEIEMLQIQRHDSLLDIGLRKEIDLRSGLF